MDLHIFLKIPDPINQYGQDACQGVWPALQFLFHQTVGTKEGRRTSEEVDDNPNGDDHHQGCQQQTQRIVIQRRQPLTMEGGLHSTRGAARGTRDVEEIAYQTSVPTKNPTAITTDRQPEIAASSQ